MMKRILVGAPIVLVATLAAAIAFGTASAPVALAPRQLDLDGLPALRRYVARDGAALGYRAYAGDVGRVAVLIHGSGTESSVMNGIAKTLQANNASAYAVDLRGHGSSGRRGDIDYIGQLDDDLADFMAAIRPQHPHASFTLIGFSAGGAFTMRIAGSAYGDLFDRYVVISPAITFPADVARPNAGGWATPHLPRIIGLVILNQLGIHWLDGLEAITFAVPPGTPNRTAAYSFRLAMNIGSRGFEQALRRTTKPMVLLAGASDDQFYADRYAPLLKPEKPDLEVEIVPDLGHVDMLIQPAALEAVKRAAKLARR